MQQHTAAHAADQAEQRRQQMEMQQQHLSELEKARAEVDAAQLRAENSREQEVAALQELEQQHVLLLDAQQALARVKRDADARALNEQRLRLVLEVFCSVFTPQHVLCLVLECISAHTSTTCRQMHMHADMLRWRTKRCSAGWRIWRHLWQSVR